MGGTGYLGHGYICCSVGKKEFPRGTVGVDVRCMHGGEASDVACVEEGSSSCRFTIVVLIVVAFAFAFPLTVSHGARNVLE